MASKDIVQKLLEAADDVLAFDKQDLRERSDWGKFDFNDAEPDLKRIFTIVAHLSTLPLELLPEDTATSLEQAIRNVVPALDGLAKFDIATGNPAEQRQSLATATTNAADALYKQVTPSIPFLAYQKGDVAENIGRLTKAVTEGRQLVEGAKAEIESRSSEMNEIIEKAREASASAGAAVFTDKFDTESKERKKSAKAWSIATVALALTSAVAASFIVSLNGDSTSTSLIQAGPKFFLLALLLTATLWTGRMYKAFMHQAAVNRHRALALQTFQAFSAAASDELTKNAVLLEATHSIFGPSESGFLDSKVSPADPGTKIVEIMKVAGSG